MPFTDNFRSRFTFGNYDRDGYITSTTTGAKSGAFQDEVARADFMWEPSDRVSVRFNAQDDEIVSNTARVQTWIENRLAWNTGYPGRPRGSLRHRQPRRVWQGRWNCDYACSGWPGGRLDEWESTSEITRAVAPMARAADRWIVKVDVTDNIGFQYLLGHTDVDARTYNDWDSGEFNFYIDYFNNQVEFTSHEFQFAGGTDRISWVGGAYLWDQEGRNRNPAYSMREWSDYGNNYGQAQPFNYTTMVRPSPACQRTPASLGLDFTGQVNAAHSCRRTIVRGRRNTVAGWPFPCDFAGGGGWVAALAAGATAAAGDRLTGNEIDGWAAFGEVVDRHHREVRPDARLPLPRPGQRAVLVQRRGGRCGRHHGAAAGRRPTRSGRRAASTTASSIRRRSSRTASTGARRASSAAIKSTTT